MSSAFAVTASSATVHLDRRRGQVTFTVTNTTARPIRCRARVELEAGEAAGWIKLEDDPERQILSLQTHQFTVGIVVPPDAPPGQHRLVFHAISVDNPDEDFVVGPPVSFAVEDAPVPRKPFPWWILIVVGAVVVVAAVVIWMLTRDSKAVVPGVIGKPVAAAVSELEELGFEVEAAERVVDADGAVGTIVEQWPGKSAELPGGSVVELVVKDEKAAIPDGLLDGNLRSAVEALFARKLVLGEIHWVRSTDALGRVHSSGAVGEQVAGLPVRLGLDVIWGESLPIGLTWDVGEVPKAPIDVFLAFERRLIEHVALDLRTRFPRPPTPEPAVPEASPVVADAAGLVKLAWSTVPGAESYGVELSYEMQGPLDERSRPLKSVTNITRTAYHFHPRLAPRGRWRVWSVREGITSLPSAWRKFEARK